MNVLGFDEALAVVLAHAANVVRPGCERVDLLDAPWRVLAEEVGADRDQPPFARCTRDGFAVRAEELSGNATLRVAGVLKAGDRWEGVVGSGEAVQIMTGAPMPKGVDAVAMVEFVERDGDWIRSSAGRRLGVGENVVPRGSEAAAGQVVLGIGTSLGPAEIALAAACGRADLEVFTLPTVGIVATGDELVELGTKVLDEQQIWNSNSYALAAMVGAVGGVAERLGVARDVREEVRERVAAGRRFDLLILSGGVSMGEYDLVEEVLAEAGAEFFFTGVKMQPGRPVVFGRLPGRDGLRACFFFGLPGNPISTQVTFHCFVEPMLRAMGGGIVEGPRFTQATLGEDVVGKAGLMRLLPARVSRDRVRPEVKLVAWQGSGDVAANARANCYAVLPPERESFRAGDVISVMLR